MLLTNLFGQFFLPVSICTHETASLRSSGRIVYGSTARIRSRYQRGTRMHIERGYKRFGSGITACSSRASAAKVSDFIRTVRILKVSFYAYFTRIRIFRTVSLYVKHRTIRIFGFFTVELRIFPERSWQHCRAQLQLIALARASWRVARLALSTRGERKFAGANWCQVSLHCQLRITTHGIQHGMAVPLLDYTPPPLFTS